MHKTTVYLTEDQRRTLRQLAGKRGCSEADLVREAIGLLTRGATAPKPKVPLFRGCGAPIAERIDEVLAEGFGQR